MRDDQDPNETGRAILAAILQVLLAITLMGVSGIGGAP